ncbi:hypothetical protein L195_g049701 [Trifolium pratense]|uniref:Uncharacterized protein n=1 Tax=Trifolium pratense TaxID=57577 RepID=A0A2K3JPX6_TRIPR|nr:hypothetical protein L195_g049701 [Trifolium pratense]
MEAKNLTVENERSVESERSICWRDRSVEGSAKDLSVESNRSVEKSVY